MHRRAVEQPAEQLLRQVIDLCRIPDPLGKISAYGPFEASMEIGVKCDFAIVEFALRHSMLVQDECQ